MGTMTATTGATNRPKFAPRKRVSAVNSIAATGAALTAQVGATENKTVRMEGTKTTAPPSATQTRRLATIPQAVNVASLILVEHRLTRKLLRRM